MKGRSLLRLVLGSVLLAFISGPSSAQGPTPQAPVGSAFSYQGQLRQNELPVSGTCDFRFVLWDALSGGAQVGPMLTQPGVAVTRGLFTAVLDFGASAFQGDARFLAMQVRCPSGSGDYTALLPRQALTAVPYALYSTRAPWSGLTGVPAGLADGVDNDTVYTAGAGLTLTGTQFGVQFAGTGSANTVARSDHTHPVTGWSLTGNAGTDPTTNFLGTTDAVSLTLGVSGRSALRLEPTDGTPNLIGGYSGNTVAVGAEGATIAGGGANGSINRVLDAYGTVGGGDSNTAGGMYATVGGGEANTASGAYSTVPGGSGNTAQGAYSFAAGRGAHALKGNSTVAGGEFNTADGDWATVSGGSGNRAFSFHSTVSGGEGNVASGSGSTVSGGSSNEASGIASTVSGGEYNEATAAYATVSGGGWGLMGPGDQPRNRATDEAATVGGGAGNLAGNANDSTTDALAATVAGGFGNQARGRYSAVAGGAGNQASGETSAVAGGGGNQASGESSAVAGGEGNQAGGAYSTVPGGSGNTAQGAYSFAAGRRAQALHDGSFVWADSTDAALESSGSDQFLVRAGGGVMFDTTERWFGEDGHPYTGPGGGTHFETSSVSFGSGFGSLLSMSVNWFSRHPEEEEELSPSIEFGYSGNSIQEGTVGSTISGGGGTFVLYPEYEPPHTDYYVHPNRTYGNFSTVGGGLGNTAGPEGAPTGYVVGATVAGGDSNTAGGGGATVGGGVSNTANGDAATVGGGSHNVAVSSGATVSGGSGNTAWGNGTTVAGGEGNTSKGYGTVVGGGRQNSALGVHSSIGGGEGNEIDAEHATISGGMGNIVTGTFGAVGGGLGNSALNVYTVVGGGLGNHAEGDASTVAGGAGNRALGLNATVGGGNDNYATGTKSTVAGGWFNVAEGDYATVPGGALNSAAGDYSFAAGHNAAAEAAGCFVWADSLVGDVRCTNANRWVARATGGYYLYTNAGLSVGARLPTGSGSWSSVSDRNLKENFQPADASAVLEQLMGLPISSWNYTSQDESIHHIGPTAQDFSAAFGVGEDDTSISTVDADGVALAAIQGLYQMVREKDVEIAALRAENSGQQQQLDDLQARMAALEQAVNGKQAAGIPALPGGAVTAAAILVAGLLGAAALRRRGGRR